MHERKWIPLEEAARALNSTPLNILMHVKRGLLQGGEVEGLWMIDSQSLAALLQVSGDGQASGVCASGCSKKTACGGGCS